MVRSGRDARAPRPVFVFLWVRKEERDNEIKRSDKRWDYRWTGCNAAGDGDRGGDGDERAAADDRGAGDEQGRRRRRGRHRRPVSVRGGEPRPGRPGVDAGEADLW